MRKAERNGGVKTEKDKGLNRRDAEYAENGNCKLKDPALAMNQERQGWGTREVKIKFKTKLRRDPSARMRQRRPPHDDERTTG